MGDSVMQHARAWCFAGECRHCWSQLCRRFVNSMGIIMSMREPACGLAVTVHAIACYLWYAWGLPASVRLKALWLCLQAWSISQTSSYREQMVTSQYAIPYYVKLAPVEFEKKYPQGSRSRCVLLHIFVAAWRCRQNSRGSPWIPATMDMLGSGCILRMVTPVVRTPVSKVSA